MSSRVSIAGVSTPKAFIREVALSALVRSKMHVCKSSRPSKHKLLVDKATSGSYPLIPAIKVPIKWFQPKVQFVVLEWKPKSRPTAW